MCNPSMLANAGASYKSELWMVVVSGFTTTYCYKYQLLI